jgi:glycerol uptake facilitator-like aquaporin
MIEAARLDLVRRSAVEALGTLLLVAGVVGSGIMAERLAAGNAALALLCNAVATGALLVALIATLGPLSGAHLNPVVTIADAVTGGTPRRDVAPYVIAQVVGAVAGTVVANAMFSAPLVAWARHVRTGPAQWLSETVATFGLLLVVRIGSRHRPGHVAFLVAAYITAAYWFTASTSFANPAVTLARAFTDTFAGIRPADVPGFVVAQIAGASAATAFSSWLWRESAPVASPALRPLEEKAS